MSRVADAPRLFAAAPLQTFLAIATYHDLNGEDGFKVARVHTFTHVLATEIMEAEIYADYGTTARLERRASEHGDESPVYITGLEVYSDAELAELDVLTGTALAASLALEDRRRA